MTVITLNPVKDTQQHNNIPGAAATPRRTGDRGQSLLEFALMLPFMILLAVGIVEIGRAIYYTVAVNNGATAGAEFGSQDEITASNTTKMQLSAVCDANGGSPPSCRSGILTTSNVTVTTGCACDTGTGTSCNPMPPANSCATIVCSNQIAECVQVLTTATYDPLFHYPGLPTSYTANGKAVMRVRK
jgi:Flp pilus assembly protein TadG